MKQNRFLYLLNDIDEELLEASDFPQKKITTNLFLKYGSIAACFCLLAAASFGISKSINPTNHTFPTPSISEISTDRNKTEIDSPNHQILISLFEATAKDSESDAFGEDELHHVDVILHGNILYEQIPEDELFVYGIGDTLSESDFGEALGTITEIDSYSEAILSTPCSQEPNLADCKVFYYQPVNCEAIIIVSGNGHNSLFRFMNFTEEGFSYSDEYKIFNVLSADNIEKIDYKLQKSDGSIFITTKEGSITDSASKQLFFDITMKLQPYVHESPLSGSLEWYNEAKAAYKQLNIEEQINVEVSIILKNGLTMTLYYQPNLGTGYISGHYFLSETDNDIMKSMFLQ